VVQMSIGELARSSRLSAKALRLDDELGLLPPADVDEDSAYRFYAPGQLEKARLTATLRQLQLSLAELKAILALELAEAARRVRLPVSGCAGTMIRVARPADAAACAALYAPYVTETRS